MLGDYRLNVWRKKGGWERREGGGLSQYAEQTDWQKVWEKKTLVTDDQSPTDKSPRKRALRKKAKKKLSDYQKKLSDYQKNNRRKCTHLNQKFSDLLFPILNEVHNLTILMKI